jgi:hypothetical protein
MPQRGEKKSWGVWKWIGCGCGGCLVAILLVVGLIAAIGGLAFVGLKQADAYKLALERAQNNPQVQAALGEPIEAGLLVSGSVNISGPTGSADISIPISGPKGKGTIYVVATKSAGQWEFSTLEVEIHATGERVDLLGLEIEHLPEEAPAGTPVSVQNRPRPRILEAGRTASTAPHRRPVVADRV